jgi:hypothetical protein
LGQHGEGLGEQSIPSQDSHPLAEDDVGCRFAAAKIVVIHAREVVMDERVGVDHLNGASGGQGLVRGAAAGFGCGAAKNRAQALATG